MEEKIARCPVCNEPLNISFKEGINCNNPRCSTNNIRYNMSKSVRLKPGSKEARRKLCICYWAKEWGVYIKQPNCPIHGGNR